MITHRTRHPGAGACLALGAALLLSSVGCNRGTRHRPEVPHRFAQAGPHTVVDGDTGLRWIRVSGESRSWDEAKAWCETLTTEGRGPWRLPSIDELRGLYDESETQDCNGEQPCRVQPVIELGGPWFWSGSSAGVGRRYYLDFRFGTVFSPMLKPGLRRRVLCVLDEGSPAPVANPGSPA